MAFTALGFPEFTRFFNPDYSGKLQWMHEVHDDNWHRRVCICQAPPSSWTIFVYILSWISRRLFPLGPCGGIPEPQYICRSHKARSNHPCSLRLFGAILFGVLQPPESNTRAYLHTSWHLISCTPLTAACSTIELSRKRIACENISNRTFIVNPSVQSIGR